MRDNETTDRQQLKSIARQLLGHLEQAISSVINPYQCSPEEAQQKYDKIFGTRNSYVSALIDLGELMLKLDRSEEITTHETSTDASRLTIDSKDAMLIDDFIKRQKEQQSLAVAEIFPA